MALNFGGLPVQLMRKQWATTVGITAAQVCQDDHCYKVKQIWAEDDRQVHVRTYAHT